MLPPIANMFLNGYVLATMMTCPAPIQAPTAEIRAMTAPLQIVNSLDNAQTKSKTWSIDAVPKLTYNATMRRTQIGGGSYCLYLEKIIADFQFTPVLSINAAYKPGSCEYNLAVKSGRQLLTHLITTLSSNLPVIRDPLNKEAATFSWPNSMSLDEIKIAGNPVGTRTKQVIENSLPLFNQKISERMSELKEQFKSRQEKCP